MAEGDIFSFLQKAGDAATTAASNYTQVRDTINNVIKPVTSPPIAPSPLAQDAADALAADAGATPGSFFEWAKAHWIWIAGGVGVLVAGGGALLLFNRRK